MAYPTFCPIQRITSITVNGKNAYKLKGKFINDLHKNAFDGTNGEDAVKYIKYFLRIFDPVDLQNVNQDKLRVVVFPISLVGSARRWFDEIKGSIDSWVDLTAKFFGKYYPPSRTGKINTPMIKWDPTNPKFESWIKINLFDYETPLCEEFKEFNYLLKIDPDLLTKDVEGFKTYEDYKDDWIYEWNKDIPWVHEKPWVDNGVWEEPKPVEHCCKPFNYITGCSKWPTCSWRNNGYYNRGNLPGAYIIGNSLHYQDYEWYDCEDSNHDHEEQEYMDEHDMKDEELFDNATQERAVCLIKRYVMIKTSRKKKLTILVDYLRSGILAQ
ncbi:hypothetical protein Tco_0672243 [Tanacetum coccineum]